MKSSVTTGNAPNFLRAGLEDIWWLHSLPDKERRKIEMERAIEGAKRKVKENRILERLDISKESRIEYLSGQPYTSPTPVNYNYYTWKDNRGITCEEQDFWEAVKKAWEVKREKRRI